MRTILTREQQLYAQMRFSQAALKIQQDFKDVRHTMKVEMCSQSGDMFSQVDFDQGGNTSDDKYTFKSNNGWVWTDLVDVTFKQYPDRQYCLRLNVFNTEHRDAILPLDVDLVYWKYNEDNCDKCDWHDAFRLFHGNSVSDRYAELSTGKGPISPETTMTFFFEGTLTCLASKVLYYGPEGKYIDGIQWLGMTVEERRKYHIEARPLVRPELACHAELDDEFQIEDCTMTGFDNPNHCTDGLSRVIDAVNASQQT